MSGHGSRTGIPDRWLDYTAVGKRLDGTRFIAFKVPLKQSFNSKLPSGDAFGPWELLDSVTRENQELGLIIDLTFTTRYYKLQDVPESLLVVKIFTAGHKVPSDDKILSFKRVVRRFIRDNADNDKLIGVHCTHGLNRTGYLICRYLIDVDGMDPKKALDLFNSSRGHSIERKNYVEDLQRGPKRSNEGMDEAEEEPMRGLAARRPSLDSDSREDRRPPFSDSRYHSRSFPPRGAIHRSQHHHPRGPLPSPPMGAPLPSYQWAHPDSGWRRNPCSEETRSRYPPREDSGSRYPPREDSRSKYPPQEDSRSRYPPQEDSRSRYPPQEDSRSKYPPQEDSRSRYPPQEDSRSRYPPQEDSRSRYPPQEDSRSRYPPRGNSRSRHPPRVDSRSRHPPPELERRTRYPPSSHLQEDAGTREDRRRCPPVLPRYSPSWTNKSNGPDRPEDEWASPKMRHDYSQTHAHRVKTYD